ncbi:glycine receptor subunit alpha-2-like isoform X2 [Oratosquilla oratoria]|uniref:glycine receptor subunit alpha-2-like isoform X2 n=1 Tax=Oratosquilla oratoria TaxID=337810 RepID=UPI003F767EF1
MTLVSSPLSAFVTLSSPFSPSAQKVSPFYFSQRRLHSLQRQKEEEEEEQQQLGREKQHKTRLCLTDKDQQRIISHASTQKVPSFFYSQRRLRPLQRQKEEEEEEQQQLGREKQHKTRLCLTDKDQQRIISHASTQKVPSFFYSQRRLRPLQRQKEQQPNRLNQEKRHKTCLCFTYKDQQEIISHGTGRKTFRSARVHGRWNMAGVATTLLLVLAASIPQGCCGKLSDLQILDRMLKSYDRRETPTNHLDNATNVNCELYIRSFGSIDPSSMDYQVDLYLRQAWVDQRLNHKDITQPLDLNDPNLVKAIWKPEVYFPNAKHAEFQFVTVPNVLVRINPQGEILYMLRLKLVFACMMELSKFPLDAQVCTMEIASFSKTMKELSLSWKNDSPIKMYKSLRMPQFEMERIVPTTCQESFQIGNYSCLVAEFHMRRAIGFHLVQSYLPTILIVVISWVSFWMDVDSVPGRTTLGVTTLLTVSAKSSGIQGGLPQVSYVKAIDVWMGACTAFVFCALLEFTLVNYLWRRRPCMELRGRGGSNGTCLVDKYSQVQTQPAAQTPSADSKEILKGSKGETPTDPPPAASSMSSNKEGGGTKAAAPKGAGTPSAAPPPRLTTPQEDVALLTTHFVKALKHSNKIKARKIDEYSRGIFPLLFGCFNVVYWCYYLLY